MMLLLLLALCGACVGAANLDYPMYLDPSQPVETRVDDLMSRMTLVERQNQLFSVHGVVASVYVRLFARHPRNQPHATFFSLLFYHTGTPVKYNMYWYSSTMAPLLVARGRCIHYWWGCAMD